MPTVDQRVRTPSGLRGGHKHRRNAIGDAASPTGGAVSILARRSSPRPTSVRKFSMRTGPTSMSTQGSPQVSGLISIDRSPTVTGAVPSRPQTEPDPGTDATPPDDERNAQLRHHLGADVSAPTTTRGADRAPRGRACTKQGQLRGAAGRGGRHRGG